MKSICKTDRYGKYWIIPKTKSNKLSFHGLGIPHREDGPAIEYHNDVISWYLNDKKVTPTIEMMEKNIRLNPDNISKDYHYPLEIQLLAISLKQNVIFNIKFPSKKLKEYYPQLMALREIGLT